MKNFNTCVRSAFWIVAATLLPLSASAQPTQKLPAAVKKHIDSLAKTCVDAGGRPPKLPLAVTAVDLTGDGIADYLVDEGAFVCDGAASLFTNAGGSAAVTIYVGTADGRAFEAFGGQVTEGTKIDRTTTPPKVFLVVGGPLCGQKVGPDTPRGAMKACWRPLAWNPTRKKMEYEPLSQIRPYQ